MSLWSLLGNDEETSKLNGQTRPSWWLILLIVLFPIPFSPWWLTIICLAVFVALLAVFLPRAKRPSQNPPDPPLG
jgi:membrane protein implicated in regulation of membrane protease activity